MPIPPEAPTRRDAEATRRRLIAAALELFTTSGFRATTTPMLAERAGIAEGTIYRHFASKGELLNAAFREVQGWALGVVREVEAERGMGTRERLLLIGRRLLDAAARDAASVRMLLQPREHRHLDDGSRESANAFREALEQMVAGGKSDGVIRAGPAELWAGVWLAVVGFAADRVCGGEWTPDHPQASLVLTAAWDAIAAPGGVPQRT